MHWLWPNWSACLSSWQIIDPGRKCTIIWNTQSLYGKSPIAASKNSMVNFPGDKQNISFEAGLLKYDITMNVCHGRWWMWTTVLTHWPFNCVCPATYWTKTQPRPLHPVLCLMLQVQCLSLSSVLWRQPILLPFIWLTNFHRVSKIFAFRYLTI